MLTKFRGIGLKAAIVALPMFVSPGVSALPTDAEQPIHISADSASRNEQTGITRYQGNVELSQGSMRIAGQVIEIRQNREGSVTTIIARGELAHFQQQPKVDEPLTHAYGKVLDYNVRTEELVITGKAKVTQGSDRFSGNKIIYDMQKSTVNAFSGNKTQGQSERVQMVIQPKPKTPTNNSPATDADTQ